MLFTLRRIQTKSYFFSPLIISILFFFLPQTSRAFDGSGGQGQGPPVDKVIIKSIELLYECQFDRAEELLKGSIAERPKDPKGYFYLAMVSWSRLASGFWTAPIVEEYGKRIDRAISIARERIEKGEADGFTYFYLGGALGFKGRLNLMQRKWISSFFLALDAIEALQTCQKMDPLNRDVLFGLGIFDYYTARLSGVMKFLSYLLLHKGDKQEGLRKLHLAADEALFSSIEAKSVLLHIYLFLEYDYPKALSLARELAERFAGVPRYKILEGVSFIMLGRDAAYREVTAFLRGKMNQSLSKGEASIWGNAAFYLEASHDLFHDRYDAARSKLDYILSNADPLTDPGMLAWPLLKKGMSYDIEGKREMALEFYLRIRGMDNGAGAQFLAEKYIDKPAGKKDPFLGY
jgi:tetratricopeptide (TPR) repeat protein